eukprot:gene7461-10171_t
MVNFQDIFQKIDWNVSNVRMAVLVDEGIREIVKWNDCYKLDVTNETIILQLNSIDKNINLVRLKCHKPNCILYLISSPVSLKRNLIKELTHATDANEVIILTSFISEESSLPINNSSTANQNNQHMKLYNDYDDNTLEGMLSPVICNIYYFPLHTLQILPIMVNNTRLSTKMAPSIKSYEKRVELVLLSSNDCKLMKPLTLSQLGQPPEGGDFKSILDVPAADLPPNVKFDLKVLTHHLAGSIIFNLGLDPTGAVFALGKTASLVGNNLQPAIESMNKLKAFSTHHYGIQLYYDSYSSSKSINEEESVIPSCDPASLIIIDRSEDYYTPSSFHHESPLAHRVSSILKANQCAEIDIEIKSNLIHFSSGEEPIVDDALHQPMSGLSNLSLPTTPSLCYRQSDAMTEKDLQNIETLNYSIMAKKEEEGQKEMCSQLASLISIENGTQPPPKKRGVGAAVLALVQSLIESPGLHSNGIDNDIKEILGYNPSLCVKYNNMINLAASIIEAMQRSSNKQFSTLCSWQCSYDVRAARDAELEAVISQNDDLDVALAQILIYFIQGNNDNNQEKSKNNSIKMKGKAKENPCQGPVDVIYTLLSVVSELSELEYLRSISYLSAIVVDDVTRYRSCLREMNSLMNSLTDADEQSNRSSLSVDEQLGEKLTFLEEELEQLKSSVHLYISESLNPLIELHNYYCRNNEIIMTSHSTSPHHDLDLTNHPISILSDLIDVDNRDNAKSKEVVGLVARLMKEYLSQRVSKNNLFQAEHATHSNDESGGQHELCKLLEYIESPIQKMKRAGLGMLSMGLGRLGFASNSLSTSSIPRPSDNSVLIIFIIGGVSYREVQQVQSLLDEFKASHKGPWHTSTPGHGLTSPMLAPLKPRDLNMIAYQIMILTCQRDITGAI